MAFDVEECFTRGGERLIGFLSYCVVAVRPEGVAAFLIREYRSQPTAGRAVVLYESFLAPSAPARLGLHELLPPRNVRFQQEMERLAATLSAEPPPAAEADDGPPPRPAALAAAPKYVFDFLSERLVRETEALGCGYDPALSPVENLPGGRMTVGQRQFVDRVWTPAVRPRLVGAGYRKVANIPRS